MKEDKSIKGILALILGLICVAVFVSLVHFVGPRLPDAAGDVLRNNIEQDIDATGLFYTEVGDLNDFLDDENGKYVGRSY